MRAEDTIQNLKINRLGFARSVKRNFHTPGCDFGKGYENKGQFVAPDLEQILRNGIK